MTYDMVIHNGIIITVNPDFDIIDTGFIGIVDDEIRDIGYMENKVPPVGKIMIDAGDGIILPGLVNTHSHLPMTLFRGFADDLSLMEWLNEHIFPAEATHINPDSVKLGALLGCAEMILSGTTTCCDGYFLEDSVAEAILESGMRGVVGQGIIDFPAPGVPEPLKNVDIATRFVEKWKGISPRIYSSVFCHSPYTCSSDTLIKAKNMARQTNALFQIHVAETQTERKQSLSQHQATPVQYLAKLNLLDKRTLMVHSIWVDENDISIIKAAGSSIAVNTESNMKLGSGIAPLPAFLSSGIPVGLGTDGCAGNNDLDLFKEMDMTAKLHKGDTLDPTVMDAETVLKTATLGGANAIGLGDEIGSLEPGKKADIIIVDINKPHLTPLYHPVSHIVYSASGADVRDVIIAGKIIVEDYRLLTMDVHGVMNEVAQLAESINP